MKTTTETAGKQYYARQCDVTREGMNEGYVFCDGVFYCKYKIDAIAEIRKDMRKDEFLFGGDNGKPDPNPNGLTDDEILELSHENNYHYWTNWDEDPDEEKEYLL